MKREQLFTAVLALSFTAGHAQITEVGASGGFGLVQTLASVGQKLVTSATGNTGFVLLNMDLTIYQTVTYPAFPPGYVLGASAFCITESLFDTDPSTIEYMVYLKLPDENNYSTAIYRADGTLLLFAEDQRMIFGSWELEAMTFFPQIFNTPEGARLTLYSNQGGPSSCHLYSLPGSLPCVACDGTITPMGMMLGGQDMLGQDGGIRAFPNPAVAEAVISYTLPAGVDHATLVVSALNGSVVSRVPITNSGSKTITTSDMAAGTYLYHVETEQGIIGAKRLVVVK